MENGIKDLEIRMLHEFTKVREDIAELKIKTGKDIAALNVKASVWGVLGGALATVGVLLLNIFKDKLPL